MEKIDLLVLRLTDDCNLRCKYCYANGGKQKINMNREIALKAIDYVSKLNNSFTLQFTGGEPLLAIDLIEEIYEYIQKRGVQVRLQVQTNGTLIGREMAKKLKAMNMSVGISLDGMPQINDKNRTYSWGEGSAKDVLKGLNNLNDEGIKVGLTATVTKDNIVHLSQLIELSAFLGNVHGVSFDLYRPMGRGVKCDFSVCKLEDLKRGVKKALNKAEEIKAIGGHTIHIREVEKVIKLLKARLKRDKYCYVTTGTSFAVMPDGEVYPCSSFAEYKEFNFGNILDPQFYPFDRMKDFINGISVLKNEECQSCKDNHLCGGGCIARTYAYYGNFDRVYEGECALRRVYIEYAKNNYIEAN